MSPTHWPERRRAGRHVRGGALLGSSRVRAGEAIVISMLALAAERTQQGISSDLHRAKNRARGAAAAQPC